MSKAHAKYALLAEYLQRQNGDTVTLGFAQITSLIGTPLPQSAYAGRGWWANRERASSQAAAWMGAGFRVETIDLAAQTVTFVRAHRRRAAYTVRKSGDTVLWDADLIKALRAYMNLNQSQFAEHMGVRQQTVSEWEVGTYEPTRATCKYLMLVAEKAGFRYSESDSA